MHIWTAALNVSLILAVVLIIFIGAMFVVAAFFLAASVDAFDRPYQDKEAAKTAASARRRS